MTSTPSRDLNAEMFQAVIERDAAEVRELLAAGAEPNARNAFGNSALYLATKTDDCLTMRALLEAGANPDVGMNPVGEYGSPLSYACSHGCRSAATLLLEHGADPELRSEDGRTAAHHLLSEKKKPSPLWVKFAEKTLVRMLDAGVSPDSADAAGRSLLQGVLSSELPVSILMLLLERGATASQKLYNGMELVHVAASHARLDVLEALHGRGVNVNAKNNDGQTPLFYAFNDDVVMALLSMGCSIDHVDNSGKNVALSYLEGQVLDEADESLLMLYLQMGLDARQADASGTSLLRLLEAPGFTDYPPAIRLRGAVAAADARKTMRAVASRPTQPVRP